MPDFPDDPTSGLPGESERASPSTTPAEMAPAETNPQSGGASTAEAPRFPRRRRRRHRRPRPNQTAAEGQEQVTEPSLVGDPPPTVDLSASPPHRRRRRRHRGPRREADAAPATDEQPRVTEGAPDAPSSIAQSGDAVTDPVSPESSADAAETPTSENSESKPDARPRRRRRRRRPPVSVEAAPADGAPSTENAPDAAGEPRASERRRRFPRGGAGARGEQQTAGGSPADGYRGPRTARPRQRRGPAEGLPDRMRRDADAAERGPASGRQDLRDGGPERRDRDSRDRRARGRGRSGEAERRRGRGRDEPKKQAEQRLYARESVVDRGFEDVTDEAADSEPRRVHWTIIKRMVADQQSGKPISAVYVLQRDGVDTEFPSLGTARAAANKTIIHPEKLTLSKAEHVAAKGDGGGAERNRRQR